MRGSTTCGELTYRPVLSRAEARASSSHPEHGGHNARKLGLDVLRETALAQRYPEPGVQFPEVKLDPAAIEGGGGSLVPIPIG